VIRLQPHPTQRPIRAAWNELDAMLNGNGPEKKTSARPLPNHYPTSFSKEGRLPIQDHLANVPARHPVGVIANGRRK